MSRAEVEACQSRDEASLRSAIEGLTQSALAAGLAKLDYRTLVGDEWRRGNLDDVIDKQVDQVVAEIIRETSWSEQLQTWWYKEKAQAMAEQTARRVYESPAIKAALEGMTTGVAREVGRTIELSASDAAEPALACLQLFIGPRFGATVSKVVAADAEREFLLDSSRAAAQVGTGTVLAENSSAVTGAVILVVRRQLANLATRIGQRVVGSILGRLVSVVAGGIGVVLIAKDLWDARNGVLPIIASEMKSKSTKSLVQDELVKAISEQIGENSKEISTATADRVLDIWREFKRGHAKVLDLTERRPEFRAFVDTLRPSDLPRLDEVVALLLPAEGEDGVMKRLGNGTLTTAVTRLSLAGMEIARETRSLEDALGWAAVAGPSLQRVHDLGLHRRAKPGDFSAAQLARLIALDDNMAIGRLASLDRGARDVLFELGDANLKTLARALGEQDLDSLSRYLTALERPARERVLQVVAATPSKLQLISAPRVRDAVLASRDQFAAVAMMLRDSGNFDLAVLRNDVEMVWAGRVSPILLWDRHPAAIIAAGVLALALLLMLRRLFSRPRRRLAT